MPPVFRTLPERSVDGWVAAYLAQRMPAVAMWAPTQNALPDRDLAFASNGKIFVLEHKAPFTNAGAPHRLRIDIAQLQTYCNDPLLSLGTYYVLPSPVYAPTAAPPTPLVPLEAGARTAGPAPFELWAYVLRAVDLWNFLNGPASGPAIGLLPAPGTAPPYAQRTFACAELDPPAGGPLPVVNQMTLQGFVDRLRRCEGPAIRVQDYNVESAERRVRLPPSTTATLVHVDPADLPGWA